ncbi:MAG: hypothetical protein LUQ24_05190 [Methanobacterium sp.]|nr:hypothetical protein [Methanobacterium sp.]
MFNEVVEDEFCGLELSVKEVFWIGAVSGNDVVLVVFVADEILVVNKKINVKQIRVIVNLM